MTLPTIIKTSDRCFTAELDGLKTAKYGTPVGALRVLCEMLVTKREDQRRKDWPWQPTGPCECGGWGEPTGCPGCGIKCMGG